MKQTTNTADDFQKEAVVKQRCHFSIILEKAGKFLVFWFILAFSQIDDLIDLLEEPVTDETLRYTLFAGGGLLLALLLVVFYQFLVWRKTFVYFEGNTIVVERNTINRKKSTYSLANISNVNMEQNLFEMLIHTKRIKLDTDSFSTADQTDISIVFSEQKAQAFRTEVLSRMKTLALQPKTSAAASIKQILLHCICTIPAFFFFLLAVCIMTISVILFSSDVSLAELLESEEDASFSGQMLAIAVLVITYGYQILKRFSSFYQFRCSRNKDKLLIHYGLFRKQDFTMPVQRINAVKIVQAPLARLLGYYEAQIICIGVGDSAEEKAQILLCQKKKDFYQQLAQLLPEFSTEISTPVLSYRGKQLALHWVTIVLYQLMVFLGKHDPRTFRCNFKFAAPRSSSRKDTSPLLTGIYFVRMGKTMIEYWQHSQFTSI